MSTSTEERTRDRRGADCAWCGALFATIVDLLAHVEDRHLSDEDNASACSPARAVRLPDPPATTRGRDIAGQVVCGRVGLRCPDATKRSDEAGLWGASITRRA